jgi:NitT/TauT family transport system substrate-binding protein
MSLPSSGIFLFGWLLVAALIAPVASRAEAESLRIGFFPNLTHAPALAARQLAREGKDHHQPALPAGVKLEWRSFNAGPSAMEALLAGAIDVAYVGASPALNAHVRTKGEVIRVLAPVAQGGNALVVRKESGLKTAKDFIGRILGTPQLGNTQDIDARTWLREGGLNVHLSGGDARVVPAQNADLMLLFSRGEIDAVWTVEPWVTRLTSEFGGVIAHENKDALITVLVTSRAALEKRRPVIEAFVRSHYALCNRLRADPSWQEKLVREGLAAELRSQPPKAELIGPALARVSFAVPENLESRRARLAGLFARALKDAQESRLLKGDAPMDPLLESLVDDPKR